MQGAPPMFSRLPVCSSMMLVLGLLRRRELPWRIPSWRWRRPPGNAPSWSRWNRSRIEDKRAGGRISRFRIFEVVCARVWTPNLCQTMHPKHCSLTPGDRPKTRHGDPFRGQQLFAARSIAHGTMVHTKRTFLNALGFKMCPRISSKMVSGMPFGASWGPFGHSLGRLGRQQALGSAQDEPSSRQESPRCPI